MSSNRPNWHPLIDYSKIIAQHLQLLTKIIAQHLQLLTINKYTISDTLAFPDILKKNLLDSNEEYAPLMMWIRYSPAFC